MIMVSASVVCEDETSASKVVEVLSRVVTGLALEGKMASLNIQVLEDVENTPSVGSEDLEGPS